MKIKISTEELAGFLDEIRKYGYGQGYEAGLKDRPNAKPVEHLLKNVLPPEESPESRLDKIENHLAKLSGSYETLANKMFPELVADMTARKVFDAITERVEEDQGKADKELADMVGKRCADMLAPLILNGQPKHPEIIPMGIFGNPENVPGENSENPENVPGENPAEIYEKAVEVAAAAADPCEDARNDSVDAMLAGFTPYQPAADEEPATAAEAEKVLVVEETGGETVGEHFHAEPVEDPRGEYTNKLHKPEKAPALHPSEVPTYDSDTDMYIVLGQAYIGKELWNQKKYREWFNDEICRLRAEGRSQQYIADRFKVTQRAVGLRIARDHLD